MEVRTTMRPWEPIEVDQREALDLGNMGLLVEDQELPPSPLPDRAKFLDEQREQAKAEAEDTDSTMTQDEKNTDDSAKARSSSKKE